MTALMIAVTIAAAVTVAAWAATGLLREASGRLLEAELNAFAAGGSTWIDTTDTCEALSLSLIRWSDAVLGKR